jgi:heme oxygenase
LFYEIDFEYWAIAFYNFDLYHSGQFPVPKDEYKTKMEIIKLLETNILQIYKKEEQISLLNFQYL